MFNKWQAQRWWSENCEKITELYNVQQFNQQGVPLPSPPRSEPEVSFFNYILKVFVGRPALPQPNKNCFRPYQK
ncbi:putative brevis radix (BRX) domain, protein BREVIS RADIX [Helianthus annuus]|nr:putative brevis radix (BRX) domain, protein BREVIS RADIX [Helianthus annuus]